MYTFRPFCWLCPFNHQIRGAATALKAYGLVKSQVGEAMRDFHSYYQRKAETSYDRTSSENKIQIANAYNRAIWCELFTDDIQKLF